MHVVKIKVKATGKTVEVGAETAASMVQGGYAVRIGDVGSTGNSSGPHLHFESEEKKAAAKGKS